MIFKFLSTEPRSRNSYLWQWGYANGFMGDGRIADAYVHKY